MTKLRNIEVSRVFTGIKRLVYETNCFITNLSRFVPFFVEFFFRLRQERFHYTNTNSSFCMLSLSRHTTLHI